MEREIIRKSGSADRENSQAEAEEVLAQSGGSWNVITNLHSLPLFFQILGWASAVPHSLPLTSLTACATAQAKPCLPALGGPWW
jgi:hypothetical protein